MVIGQNLVPVSRSWRIVVATRPGDGGIFSSLAGTEPTPQTLFQQYRSGTVTAGRTPKPAGTSDDPHLPDSVARAAWTIAGCQRTCSFLAHHCSTQLRVFYLHPLAVPPRRPRANWACSRKARTNLARSEALFQSRPVRRTSERSGSANLRSDNPSGHGGAQSGSNETPSPRSTITAISSKPSSS